MSSWGLLDEKEELELHKTRLLNVEERPFKRITKRVGAVSSLVSSVARLKPSEIGAPDLSTKPDTTVLKEEITTDFAAFDAAILRLQFLHTANIRERERYAADQENIIQESQAARVTNADLREKLAAAQATLAQRKKFDEMAEKITSNRLLKPREDQIANLAKLEEECRELERESQTYSVTWRERKDQFNRIMEEGMLLRRQIRDEKEEVDRREGMDEGEDDEAGAPTPRPDQSGDATPHPEGDGHHRGDADGETAGTPARDSPAPSSLQPPQGHLRPQSRSGSQQPSRDATPAPRMPASGREEEQIDREDEDMDEPKESVPTAEDEGAAQRTDEDRMEVDN
jgi:hypothetical protein